MRWHPLALPEIISLPDLAFEQAMSYPALMVFKEGTYTTTRTAEARRSLHKGT